MIPFLIVFLLPNKDTKQELCILLSNNSGVTWVLLIIMITDDVNPNNNYCQHLLCARRCAKEFLFHSNFVRPIPLLSPFKKKKLTRQMVKIFAQGHITVSLNFYFEWSVVSLIIKKNCNWQDKVSCKLYFLNFISYIQLLKN